MKILYCGGFTTDEMTNYKDILLKNTMIGMQELVKQSEKLDLQVSSENKKRARFFRELNTVDQLWSPDIGKKLKLLWDDPALQQTWAVAPEYQLQMSMMDYHMANLERYSAEDFLPTNEDMLRARQRTTGMQSTTFDIESYEWTLVDVGGQKPERAKWEAILDDGFHAVIFFAALDEYNMASSEEAGKTKMQVALEAFGEACKSEKIHNLTILLFLNKSDLFKKKIENTKDYESFTKTFPEYQGGQDIDKATEYITKLFSSHVTDRENEDLHIHVTCALDTDAMDKVFSAVKETLFMNRMAASGIRL